jgi:transposase
VNNRETRINVETTSLDEILLAMRCTPTEEGFYRLQGISFLYKGFSKEEVSNLLNVTLRSVQKWVKNFNEAGIEGLLGSRRTGRKRKIDSDVFGKKYKDEFLSSSKTALCFHGELLQEHQEQLSYSTFLKYLREHKLVRTVGRPRCVQQEPARREDFLRQLNDLVGAQAHVWFCDEVGFNGDPKPRKKWVKKGEKHSNPFYKLHLRSNAIGAANPGSGEFFSHVVPHVDTEIFQHFLDEFNTLTKKDAEKGKAVVLVLDNAKWHVTNALKWGHVKPLFLPPYSPDLNPIEQLWKLIKDRFFNGWYAKNIEELDQRVCLALSSLIADNAQVKKTSCMDYMLRNL